jgi:hypothetical protein
VTPVLVTSLPPAQRLQPSRRARWDRGGWRTAVHRVGRLGGADRCWVPRGRCRRSRLWRGCPPTAGARGTFRACVLTEIPLRVYSYHLVLYPAICISPR